ncbi:uncharacterized protein LOC131146341 isoform X5 [Malania oleifera]|nr:uncharacterized protein LOC131146341 isoform X5 [Malania oleifera]
MGRLSDRVKSRDKQFSSTEVQSSLKQEIMQLEKKLQDQFEVRHVLEKALGYRSSSQETTNEIPANKPASELIKEIAVLELEVVHLEQHLLSLYRKAFDQQLSSLSPPPAKDERYAQSASPNVISLAEHLGTHISDHVSETPNKLSEDMIKCMSVIYCKLADPPLTHHALSSPNSSLSSTSAFSPQEQFDMWSPGFKKDSSFDVRLDNPFLVEGLKEFSGPYSTIVELQWIYRDGQKFGDIELLLQSFKSLICRLEVVDPKKMKREEKLAFWINIHNALVMHTFLAYGIPQNNVKRIVLLLKAAYNIGGHTISAETIQSCILGCRMPRPGQWLRLLLPSRTKFKAGDERQAYAIEHPEPLLHFALCSGSHSDPAIRVYTPKRVFQELEAAKEEYIRATFGVRKDQKILLPKVVQSFVKDLGLCPGGVMEMIQQCLPESVRKNIKKSLLGKSQKGIEWVPHNFTFRYLISKELK